MVLRRGLGGGGGGLLEDVEDALGGGQGGLVEEGDDVQGFGLVSRAFLVSCID